MIELYKYLSISNLDSWKYRKQLIAERTLYFSDPTTFNDPLDCNIATWERAKDYLNPARIFCLSTSDRNDDLMFAHYADEHRGIRLKFVVDDDQTIGDSSVLALGDPVIYVDNLPDFSNNNAHKLYFMKSRSQSYESEYRILLTKSTTAKFETNELQEIALGVRFE